MTGTDPLSVGLSATVVGTALGTAALTQAPLVSDGSNLVISTVVFLGLVAAVVGALAAAVAALYRRQESSYTAHVQQIEAHHEARVETYNAILASDRARIMEMNAREQRWLEVLADKDKQMLAMVTDVVGASNKAIDHFGGDIQKMRTSMHDLVNRATPILGSLQLEVRDIDNKLDAAKDKLDEKEVKEGIQ